MATHIHDASFAEISRDTWMIFVQSASQDMESAGWLIPTNDNTSLVVVANQFVYNVPTPFAYIEGIYIEEVFNAVSVYTRWIPDVHWTLRLQGGVAVIQFYTVSSLEVGRHLQLVGQKRPTVYTNLTDTIDPGVEAFMRERTLAYGARYAGAGLSEYAKWRQVIAGQAWNQSERTLRLLPQEFRQRQSARAVPGRES